MPDLPPALVSALSQGHWRDPGPGVLRRALNLAAESEPLELFSSQEIMQSVYTGIEARGYVDDREFCMVRRRAELMGDDDPRLVYSEALFIGGSKLPGDDVLLACELSGDRANPDPKVLWFDWSRRRPGRWVRVTSLSSLLEAVGAALGS